MDDRPDLMAPAASIRAVISPNIDRQMSLRSHSKAKNGTIARSQMNEPISPNRPLNKKVFISSDERRLRAGWRILVEFLLFIVFASTAYFVIFPKLPEGLYYDLVAELVRLLVITIPIYLARRLLDRRTFLSLGLTWNSKAIRDLLAGFLIGGISLTMIFIFEWAMGWLRVKGFAWQEKSWSIILVGVIATLVIFAMNAWSEEFAGAWLLVTEYRRWLERCLGSYRVLAVLFIVPPVEPELLNDGIPGSVHQWLRRSLWLYSHPSTLAVYRFTPGLESLPGDDIRFSGQWVGMGNGIDNAERRRSGAVDRWQLWTGSRDFDVGSSRNKYRVDISVFSLTNEIQPLRHSNLWYGE